MSLNQWKNIFTNFSTQVIFLKILDKFRYLFQIYISQGGSGLFLNILANLIRSLRINYRHFKREIFFKSDKSILQTAFKSADHWWFTSLKFCLTIFEQFAEKIWGHFSISPWGVMIKIWNFVCLFESPISCLIPF